MGITGSITYLTASRQFTLGPASFSILSSLVLSIVGGIVFYFAYIGFLSTSFLIGITNTEIILVLISLPINMVSLFLSSIILGKQQLYAYNLINILRVVSQLLLIVISSLLRGGVYGAVLSWLVSSIIGFLATLWMVRSILISASLSPGRYPPGTLLWHEKLLSQPVHLLQLQARFFSGEFILRSNFGRSLLRERKYR